MLLLRGGRGENPPHGRKNGGGSLRVSWWVEAGPKESSQQLPCHAESWLVNGEHHSLLPHSAGSQGSWRNTRPEWPHLSATKPSQKEKQIGAACNNLFPGFGWGFCFKLQIPGSSACTSPWCCSPPLTGSCCCCSMFLLPLEFITQSVKLLLEY